MKFSKRSLDNLSKVDARLRLLFEVAIETSPYDFAITHGHLNSKKNYMIKGARSRAAS